MGALLDLLVDFDHLAIRATDELRWAPATAILALVSAWWVKGPLLVAVGWCADLRHGRRGGRPRPAPALADDRRRRRDRFLPRLSRRALLARRPGRRRARARGC